ncbi:MAG TPA: G-D-S-L family lipolytic protein [Planctomycetaceae bacterium]|nr:G-D-S-L family lipolytic protein [Planctomycetaceae bacterium]
MMTRRTMWLLVLVVSCGVFSRGGIARGEENELARLVWGAKRLVFLGDSITAAGTYVTDFDAWLTAQKRPSQPMVICAGLPSETVSGLSEEGHAGGQFPRPDLAERLDRILKETRPDLVIACYGMNCGIYEPLDAGRFAKYQAGIRNLKSHVEQAGAKLILVTPPFYDDLRSPRKFVYNEVLDRYAEWLLEQRKEGWQVVDLHQAMTAEVARRRKTDPAFTLQPDGVHPNEAGHWFVASRLIAALGDSRSAEAGSPAEMLQQAGVSAEILPLVAERTAVRRDAYVGAAGHKRPGIAKGLTIPEAEQKAAALGEKIGNLLK